MQLTFTAWVESLYTHEGGPGKDTETYESPSLHGVIYFSFM